MAKASSPDASQAATSPSAASMAGAGHRYAVVVDGGRQYTVREGQELQIDFRHADDGTPLPAGSEVVFADVLAVSDAGKLTLGKPKVKGASVKAEVLGLVQGEKIYVQKFKRRKNYRRRTGHRALATRIRIASISA
ncbi:50S ribosomal protein L21 [Planctomycetia bacterium]|jgi:large subunit ribosomal protein L21|nr:50S ribosomal protein L21 [Planctomycetia bacterium]